MNVATSGGTSALRLVSACISPSLTTSTIFPSIVLPIPCSPFALPSSASWATDAGVSRIRAAARRYALMRKESAAATSIRSASSSSCSASWSFRGSVATSAIIGAPMRATVCLPTYDERANLEPMLRALAVVLREDDRVLVIDDNSPDGTGELADALAEELAFVSVLHRARKEGLGPAYLAGFRRALADGAELVLEMDCDFSHDPADVPRLIAAAEDGADLAIGSRYVAGGEVGNWGLAAPRDLPRRLVYTALFLRLGVKDPTAGFKCFRRVRARDDRPGDDHVARLRLPDRDDVPRQAQRLPDRRGADHVRRSHARRLEDEPLDRARGRLARAAAAAAADRRCCAR